MTETSNVDNAKTLTMTYEELAGFAFQVAGSASVPFMRDHPHYVMPEREISEGIKRLLAERGVDITRLQGFSRTAGPVASGGGVDG